MYNSIIEKFKDGKVTIKTVYNEPKYIRDMDVLTKDIVDTIDYRVDELKHVNSHVDHESDTITFEFEATLI